MIAVGDGFVVVVPVKSPGIGKSRLAPLDGIDRGELAAALATDTVAACLRTPGVVGVLVVTEDPRFAARMADLGAQTCGDGPEPGLNAALRYGAATAAERWPDSWCAALLADLADALAEIALRGRGPASFVADADGTGTTLYAAPYQSFDPRFGTDSAAAHALAGAKPVDGELASLRRDVDDVAALRSAIALGVGDATAALVTPIR